MTDYLHVFRDAPESAEYPAVLLEGSVPADLAGCLLRVGPGIQNAGKDPLHMVDGYGFVAGLYFAKGATHFRARHVETPDFLRERAAGKQLARRAFTNLPKRSANLFNVKFGIGANHDVYAWNGKLYASDITGHFALDPKTLATLGPSPLNAQVKGQTLITPMPRVLGDRLLTYSITPGVLGNDTITFHEYDPAWTEVHRLKVAVPGKNFVPHDHAATANHHIVAELGKLKVGTVLFGKQPLIDAVEFDGDRPLRLIVFPRTPGGKIHQIALPPGHQTFHMFNAFERGDELIVDATMYEGRVHFHQFFPPALSLRVTNQLQIRGPFIVRHTLNLKTGACSSKTIDGVFGEAPTLNQKLMGQPYRYGYVAAPIGRGDEPMLEAYYWFHGVAKVDFDQGQHQTWSAGPRGFVSPPVFVERPNPNSEDDGWLLTWVSNVETGKSEVVILDARALEKGPIARLGLEHLLPPTSHVEFAP
jgi:all-trans-8'-apo-beta-carotenal 15,15'-oxygenase